MSFDRPTLHDIRGLARSAGLDELLFSDDAVQFATSTGRCVVWPSSGSVLIHPKAALGATCTFVRGADAAKLSQLFESMTSAVEDGETEAQIDEELALREHIKQLGAQTELATLQLHSLLLARERDAALLAEERRAEAAARRQAALQEAQAECAAREAKVAQVRFARGSHCDHNLTHTEGFPPTLDDVKHLAVSNGGYLFVTDWFGHGYHGIAPSLRSAVDTQMPKNLEYIALGPGQQFFLRKVAGAHELHAPASFSEAVGDSAAPVSYCSFGEWGTWYVQFDDGASKWSGEGAGGMHPKLECILAARAVVDVKTVWMGRNQAFFVVLANGKVSHKNLPAHLLRAVTTTTDSARREVRALYADEETCTWLVRFSPSPVPVPVPVSVSSSSASSSVFLFSAAAHTRV